MNSTGDEGKDTTWKKDLIDRLQNDLTAIEKTVEKHLEALKMFVREEDREETPPEEVPQDEGPPYVQTTQRIISALKRCRQQEDAIQQQNNKLKDELKHQQFTLEEVEMERDVLLQQVHAYLETNSSLRIRLEEQRCQTGALQRQLNANLELKIKSLENDKEKLSDLNLEKDKQIHKMNIMLEQTANCLKNKETEVTNWKNEENNLMALLKADLRKALEEKANAEEKLGNLKERFEAFASGKTSRRVSKLKRSRSMGDVASTSLNFLESNILLEPPRDFHPEEAFKNARSKKLRGSRSWPSPQKSDERPKSPNAQLNALRRDLVNVTRKLDALKFELVRSGVIRQEAGEERKLKRKAKPVEEEEKDEGIPEKSEFNNLKNILQDAKNLNAKLENLREEKQKMIERKAKGGTTGKPLSSGVTDDVRPGGEQPFSDWMVPFFSFVLSNEDGFRDWKRREETDRTNRSPPRQDGSGDNPLKRGFPADSEIQLKSEQFRKV